MCAGRLADGDDAPCFGGGCVRGLAEAWVDGGDRYRFRASVADHDDKPRGCCGVTPMRYGPAQNGARCASCLRPRRCHGDCEQIEAIWRQNASVAFRPNGPDHTVHSVYVHRG
mgnify:CR=1 FL=1